MIRQGQLADIPAIFEIGQWYLDQMGTGYKVDGVQGRKDMRFLMNSKQGRVLVSEVDGEIVGALMGQIVKQAFVDMRYATDLAFVVKPGFPIQAVMLARHFIHWARKQPNVREVTLQISTGLANTERVARMYELLGLKNMGACFTCQF